MVTGAIGKRSRAGGHGVRVELSGGTTERQRRRRRWRARLLASHEGRGRTDCEWTRVRRNLRWRRCDVGGDAGANKPDRCGRDRRHDAEWLGQHRGAAASAELHAASVDGRAVVCRATVRARHARHRVVGGVHASGGHDVRVHRGAHEPRHERCRLSENRHEPDRPASHDQPGPARMSHVRSLTPRTAGVTGCVHGRACCLSRAQWR